MRECQQCKEPHLGRKAHYATMSGAGQGMDYDTWYARLTPFKKFCWTVLPMLSPFIIGGIIILIL